MSSPIDPDPLGTRTLGLPGREMLRAEAAAGRFPIWPDSDLPAWLDLADWRYFPLLAIDLRTIVPELHIIAIWSARKGAFRRLLAGAEAAGLAPVVVAPFPMMQSILTRWGWRSRTIGIGWEAREEWRPASARGV